MTNINQWWKRPWYFPRYSSWLFSFLFLLLALIYNYQHILFLPPQSLHQWRQCDCLSLTIHYFQNNNPFLEPSIHNLGTDGSGKTVSDFPVIYFMIAQIWKVLGYHEFLYRMIILSFFFMGLFALFKWLQEILKDSLLAIMIVLFLFSSPTLVYYANNFLMDIPAFSLALIGIYLFYKFYLTSDNKFLYVSLLLYTLAGLLKISSLLSFAAIFCLFIVEQFGFKITSQGQLFKQPKKQILLFLMVIFVQLIWYYYAATYNAEFNSGFFLIGTLPIWKIDKSQIILTIDAVKQHIKWDYFRQETQIVFLIMTIVILILNKSVPRLLGLLTIFVAVGFTFFIFLFFGALQDHDYYTINLFVLMPFVFSAFLIVLKNRYPQFYKSLWLRILILAFLIHNVDFARRRINGRYNPEIWQNKNCITLMNKLEGIEAYFQSIGIKKDDKVISISDNSINISLYLLKRDGWSGYGLDSDSLIIIERIKLGAKYLVVYDRKIYNENYIQPFIKHKVGEYREVDIFLLNEKEEKLNL